MTNSTSVLLAAQDGPWAQIRTGTVVAATGSSVSVLVGAATFPASVVVPFGVTDTDTAAPLVGSLVAVGRQDSSWTVFGTLLGVSGTLIGNGDFEDNPSGDFPSGWTLYDGSGVASAQVLTVDYAVVGSNVVAVSAVESPSVSLLYSSAVDVLAGEVLQLSAFVGADYEEETPETADAAIAALWFANDTDVYPTTISPDSVVATATDVLQVPPWTPLSGTVTVPEDGVMRMALRSSVTAGQELHWDMATVRRIG